MTDQNSARRALPQGAVIEPVAANDGWMLRTFNWPAASGSARGSILFQTGRGDMFEKYFESFSHWHDLGWDVTAFDWRGQGGSGRLCSNDRVGHVEDFAIWVDDLAHFVAGWSAASTGPHVVIGHSMGGHLVLRALVEHKIEPDAAILIAPMLGFDAPGFSKSIAHGLARILPDRWPAWPGNEKPSLPGASRQNYLTFDDNRYADELWWRAKEPSLVLGPPSWKWLDAAYRSFDAIEADQRLECVKTPILMLATAGDKLVSAAAIRRCAKRLTNAELVMFDKSVAHEILREKDGPRTHAMSKISDMLSRVTIRA
jgi:lysophospholipase